MDKSTPICDSKKLWAGADKCFVVPIDIAERLERDRAVLLGIARLMSGNLKNSSFTREEIAHELDAAIAEVEKPI